jgi:hypothetical protein
MGHLGDKWARGHDSLPVIPVKTGIHDNGPKMNVNRILTHSLASFTDWVN